MFLKTTKSKEDVKDLYIPQKTLLSSTLYHIYENRIVKKLPDALYFTSPAPVQAENILSKRFFSKFQDEVFLDLDSQNDCETESVRSSDSYYADSKKASYQVDSELNKKPCKLRHYFKSFLLHRRLKRALKNGDQIQNIKVYVIELTKINSTSSKTYKKATKNLIEHESMISRHRLSTSIRSRNIQQLTHAIKSTERKKHLNYSVELQEAKHLLEVLIRNDREVDSKL